MNLLYTFLASLIVAAVTLASAHSYGQNTTGTQNNIAATCVSCHGAKGEGNVQMNAPRIAGQPQPYLAHQLSAYAEGSRNNPVMAPIAKQLSAQQINELSTHYAALDAAPNKVRTKATVQAQRRGKTLATLGDEKAGVQACTNCHGPGGTGEPPAYPYLAGQHASYLHAALTEWRNGSRKTDPSQQMSMIAQRLSDSDIAALADYYAALSPPPPAPQRTNIPSGSAMRPAISGPSSAQRGNSIPATGTGTEQGAPTSGGSQGPGGGGAASGTGPSGEPKQ
jgi:cytochrome c553